jgi:uncharacterized alkaline shock family protein YloU
MQGAAMANTTLRRLAASAARAVPGVARVAEPDTHVRRSEGGAASVECTLTACADARLNELGATVQAAIAAALRESAGVVVRSVDVTIDDVEDCQRPREARRSGELIDHG